MIAAALLVLFPLLIVAANGALPAFLGVGGKGGGGGASLTGASFQFMPQDPVYSGISSVSGKALQVELEKLVIAVSHGALSYSPQGVNFTRGHGHWTTEMFDERMDVKRNGHPVIQMTASERLDMYTFRYHGMGQFHDVLLEKAVVAPVASSLCVADRKSAGLSKREADMCTHDTARQHMTLSQMLEQVAKILLALSDSSATQSEQLQRRLKDSYEEVVKSIKAQLEDQLAGLRRSHESYDAWQAQQKESMKDLTATNDLIEQTRLALSSSIQLVEEKQADILASLTRVSDYILGNTTALSANLTSQWSASMEQLARAAHSQAEEWAAQSNHAASELSRLSASLVKSEDALRGLNQSSEAWRASAEERLSLLQESIAHANHSLYSDLSRVHTELMDALNASQSFLRQHFTQSHQEEQALVREALATLASNVSSTFTLQGESLDGLLASLRAVNLSLSASIADAQNTSVESLQRVAESATENANLLSALILYTNQTLSENVTALQSSIVSLRTALSELDVETKSQLEVALNNVSVSLANSNSIFAKVLRELNASHAQLFENYMDFHHVVVPRLIAESAAAVESGWREAVRNQSMQWTEELSALRLETQTNSTELQRAVEITVAADLARLNASLAIAVASGESDRGHLRQEMLQRDEALQTLLSAQANHSEAQWKLLNETLASDRNASQSQLLRMNASVHALEASWLQTWQESNQQWQAQLQNASYTAHLSLEVVQQSTQQSVANLSTALATLAAAQNASLGNVQQQMDEKFAQEGDRRQSSALSLQDRIHAVNTTLSGNLQSLNESTRFQLLLLQANTTSHFLAVERHHDLLNETVQQHYLEVRREAAASLRDNVTTLLGLLWQAKNETSSNHSALHASGLAWRAQAAAELNTSYSELHNQIEKLSTHTQQSHADLHKRLQQSIENATVAMYTNVSSLSAQWNTTHHQLLSQLAATNHSLNQSTVWAQQAVDQLNTSLVSLGVRLSTSLLTLNASTQRANQTLHERVTTVNDSLTAHRHTMESALTALRAQQNQSQQQWQSELAASRASLFDQLNGTQAQLSTLAQRLESSNIAHQTAAQTLNATLRQDLAALAGTAHAALVGTRQDLSREWNASLEALSTRLAAQHAQVEKRIQEDERALHDGFAQTNASLAQQQVSLQREVEGLRTELFAEQVLLQKHIETVQGNLQAVQANFSYAIQSEQLQRLNLSAWLDRRLAESQQQTDRALQEAQMRTSISLLEQRANLSAHGEQIQQLQRRVQETEAGSRDMQQSIHGVDKQVASLTASLSSLTVDLVQWKQDTRTATDRIPLLASDLSVVQASSQGLRREVDSLTMEWMGMHGRQTELAGNVTVLSDRLAREGADRREKLQELHSQVHGMLDVQREALLLRLDSVQKKGEEDHEKLASLSTTLAEVSVVTSSMKEDVALLKKAVGSQDSLQSEVAHLKEVVRELKSQGEVQKAQWEKELAELRTAKDTASNLMVQMQRQLDQQSALLHSMQVDFMQLKGSCAGKEQVEQVKDKVMDVQQGVVQQVTNILQLVHQQQQARSSG